LPDDYPERAAYVVEGEVDTSDGRHTVGEMVVFDPGVPASVRAVGSARAMLLGGAALESPREIWWNFVSSSAERIERAKVDWQEERFAAVPGDDERIPLPDR
jgi:redox-sensitive bicupin YhaK (pirin superfamily)